jgi:RNA polymerase sigma-70 factor (ECF subfamily)
VKTSRNERPPAFDAEALGHLSTLQIASRRLTRNRSEAEDLVQEAYLHAFRSANRFTPGTNLRAWLRTILTNLSKNRRRDLSRARVRVHEPDITRAAEAQPSPEVSPEQRLLNEALGPRLQAALESMPKTLRDAVWLRDVEEMSYADMARRLCIPIGTVMSRISRGRRLLHDRLVSVDNGRSAPHERTPARIPR